MTPQQSIPMLEQVWDEDGFLGNLRQGVVDETQGDNFVSLISQIKLEGDVVPRRFLELVWYVPIFVQWQTERCVEEGYPVGKYEQLANRILTALTETLGRP